MAETDVDEEGWPKQAERRRKQERRAAEASPPRICITAELYALASRNPRSSLGLREATGSVRENSATINGEVLRKAEEEAGVSPFRSRFDETLNCLLWLLSGEGGEEEMATA